MIDYVNEKLGFYFEGGFETMISDAQLDEAEIRKWASIAVMFHHCFGDVARLSDQDKEDAFCLVEALFTKLEVDLMFGGIDRSDLDQVCEGYSFDCQQYAREIEMGVQLVEKKGLDLFRQIAD